MHTALLILALNSALVTEAQHSSMRPAQANVRHQEAVSRQSSPFDNEGKVLEDALNQDESLRNLKAASVLVNLDDNAKDFMSVDEAAEIIRPYLFDSGKFKSIDGDKNVMPVLGFTVQAIGGSEALGLRAVIVRVGLLQALPQRSIAAGSKFTLVTTWEDSFAGYAPRINVRTTIQSGLKYLSEKFSTAFNKTH